MNSPKSGEVPREGTTYTNIPTTQDRITLIRILEIILGITVMLGIILTIYILANYVIDLTNLQIDWSAIKTIN